MLFRSMFTDTGHRISPQRAIANGLMSSPAITYLVREYGYRIVQNTLEETKAGLHLINRENEHILGWRAQIDVPRPPPPNRLTWPPPIAMPWKILDFPDLAPPGPVIG